MAIPGLAECDECAVEFQDGDTIYECQKCLKIFCKKCWEEHNCIEDEHSDPTVMCDICDGERPADEIFVCDECSKCVCDNCWQEHCHKHLEEEVTEYDYEEYSDRKILKSI